MSDEVEPAKLNIISWSDAELETVSAAMRRDVSERRKADGWVGVPSMVKGVAGSVRVFGPDRDPAQDDSTYTRAAKELEYLEKKQNLTHADDSHKDEMDASKGGRKLAWFIAGTWAALNLCGYGLVVGSVFFAGRIVLSGEQIAFLKDTLVALDAGGAILVAAIKGFAARRSS